jgi:UDP:flavonoid glycosyltransferase YjiC (YdhE family)
LARALVEQGHSVRWYSGERFRDVISATGASFYPFVTAPDYDELNMRSALKDVPERNLAFQAFYYIKHVFYKPMLAYYRDLQAIDVGFDAPLVITDEWFTGAIPFAESRQKTWISYGNSPVMYISQDCPPLATNLMPAVNRFQRSRDRIAFHMQKIIFAGTQRYINNLRKEINLPPLSDFFINHNYKISPMHLKFNTQAFEFPLAKLPPAIRFVGPVIFDEKKGQESFHCLDTLDPNKPVVFVTQGSYDIADVEKLLLPAIRALSELGCQAVISTGRKPKSIIPAEFCYDGLVIEDYVPYSRILPHIDIMITNGGFGGVATALRYGVPLIICGDSEDKPVVAARVMYTGCGINLKTGKPSVKALKKAIAAILSDQKYKQEAERISADFASKNAIRESLDLIDQLLPAVECVKN